MIELDFPIEDVHGNRHEAAVLVISQLAAQSNASINLNMVNTLGVITYSTGMESDSKNIGCQVYLYKDMAALQANKIPMILRDASNSEWFNLKVDHIPTTPTGLITIMEDYLLNTILEKMKVVA